MNLPHLSVYADGRAVLNCRNGRRCELARDVEDILVLNGCPVYPSVDDTADILRILSPMGENGGKE